ncbi:MFS general substrate transporter [Karstenula rhodostoma CBS 690.94]|uniref:MFS general substrate transporter n=1 Tax=Karstenula rhodostoma CBS 690.94 TaxID=1392251 RepID=A0A9P4UFD1_9PLEO|nr:MFS general substrate transporter [Karstenula rhodostoma CBS 690.94]
MPLGILDDNKLEHVPGTAPLSELGRVDAELAGIDRGVLKHDATGQIVLVPQPSDSPNDPYNWPRWKKEMFTLVIAYGCGCVGAAIGPLLTPAFVPLATQFGVPLQTFTLGCNGSCIVAIAVGSLLCNTIAVKVGKRPVYIVTTLGLAVSSFWAAEAKSFGSLAGARALQGFCMAPFEALIPASVSDIWHVHERGFRMAIFNLGVLGGINLAGPIAGSIIEKGSFRIAMHSMGGAMVLMLILVIFFMPESAFVRHDAINIDTSDKTIDIEDAEKEKTVQIENRAAVASTWSEPRLSYVQELKPYSGYFDTVSFWRTLIRPFFLILSPIVMWATLLFTICISWLVLISITLSQIFSAPPYNFSVSSVGATNVSSFVASVLATLVAGYVVDGVATWMAKRNNGVFEPEFRLPVMITYLIFTATGFFAWGESLYKQDPWPIPVIVCMGLINLGVQLGTTSVVTYVSDCHREQSAEAFAIMNFIKNMFAFGLTFYANDWIVVQGVRDCFYVIGGTTVAVTLTTIPMYIWGKRARSWVYRYRVLDKVLKKA